MVQDFIVRLSNKLNASEDILSRCQSKLNALVRIHPAFCSDIYQLGVNLSTYNKKFIKMRRECKRFLPDTSLNSPTVSTFHHSRNTEEPETSSTGLKVPSQKHVCSMKLNYLKQLTPSSRGTQPVAHLRGCQPSARPGWCNNSRA